MNLIATSIMEGMDKHERRIAPFREALEKAKGTEGEEEAAFLFWQANQIRKEEG